MTTITCDLCGDKIQNHKLHFRVEFWDGEHPHCGSRMHKNADVCSDCLEKIASKKGAIELAMEFDDAQKITKKKG